MRLGRDWSRNPFLWSTENRAGPSNLGNVISQILLCKQITPDFNEEELSSIVKDTQDVNKIISDLQEYMPQQELHLDKGRRVCWFTLGFRSLLQSLLFILRTNGRADGGVGYRTLGSPLAAAEPAPQERGFPVLHVSAQLSLRKDSERVVVLQALRQVATPVTILLLRANACG